MGNIKDEDKKVEVSAANIYHSFCTSCITNQLLSCSNNEPVDSRGCQSTTSVENYVSCAVCEKIVHYRSLTRHMRIHTGERPFECDICNMRFVEKNKLKIHKRTSHAGERFFSCDICSQKFFQLGHLTYHMHTHTGERSFMCYVCSKQFVKSSDLKRHVRRHTGKRPYSCTLCTKNFVTSCKLRAHMRIHTGQ